MAKKKEESANIAMEVIDKINTLWVEKYRPKDIDSLVASKELKNFLKKCIEDNDIPNLLFHGTPGTGKNSIVNILKESIKNVMLIINASEERGIDVIREKVMNFAKSSAWENSLKIIVLNEADGLNYIAQDSLREIIETSSKYCRFILTCNHIGKISDAIRSRCNEFELLPKPSDIANRLIEILEMENVEFTDEFLISLIKKYHTDIRKMIHEIQSFSKANDKLDEKLINGKTDKYDDYFSKILLNKDIKKISELTKKIVLDDNIYSLLSDYVIKKHNNPDMVIIIADHAYKARIVPDKDLIFMSCIFSLNQTFN